jgi:hypothetical protein
VDAENGLAVADVGRIEDDAAVKAARTEKC